VPQETVQGDYRHDAKHVPLPSGTPVETSVSDILTWPVGATPASNAPRSGRELQLYHIAHAYLQHAVVMKGDCDIHLELSDSMDRGAPRVIVETPVDSEYCQARQNLKMQLAELGEQLNTQSGDLKQPRPVTVLGLAFQDDPHQRGSAEVATLWELHPAVVDLLSQ
jgi:hypothetical protein